MDRFQEGLLYDHDDESLRRIRGGLFLTNILSLPDESFKVLPVGIQRMLRPRTPEEFEETRRFLADMIHASTIPFERERLSQALIGVTTRWVEHEGKKEDPT
jgi:hypothetical protein